MTDPTSCRTRSIFLVLNGRRRGIEVESRKSPRYVEVRLVGRRIRTFTHHAHPRRHHA